MYQNIKMMNLNNQLIQTDVLSFAAESRQYEHGDYELYYNHEDRNYYYRQKVGFTDILFE